MNKIREGYKEYEFGVIPNDWQVKKLGDIFNDLKGGSTPSRLIDRYYTGDIPWITSGELKYKTIYNTLESITEEAVKDTNLKMYPQGTFFIAITGLEAEGTRGSCAITGVPATTNQSCLAFQPKEGFSNLYLYHWYRLYGNYIGLKYTQGTKQQSLNNKIVGKLEIPVPKLEEQEKIASILSTIDEQIDNVDALIEKNKELKKGLMQTLLTKGIGHTKFKKTEIGEIPEEWEVKKIIDIATTTSGGTPSRAKKEYYENGIYPWVKTGELYNKYISETEEYITEDALKKSSAKLVQEGAVIIAMYGATIGKLSIAKRSVTTNQACCSIICNDNICYNEYLYYRLDFEKENIINLGAGGAQPNISQDIIKSYKLAIPSIVEQQRIALILSEIDEKIDEYENKKKKLEELKKGLMQQLLTGMIRVTV